MHLHVHLKALLWLPLVRRHLRNHRRSRFLFYSSILERKAEPVAHSESTTVCGAFTLSMNLDLTPLTETATMDFCDAG